MNFVTMNPLLRLGQTDDADWVRDQYEHVGFLPSELGREIVVIALVDGERAGVGRLVPLGARAWELGGMFVLDPYRGHGLARSIVEDLKRRAGEDEVYCVPFADLEPFYVSTGFRRVPAAGIPERLQQKLDWCASNIARTVILMKLDR